MTASQPVVAQTRTSITVWTGASFDSRGPLGAVEGRHFFVAGVRMGYDLSTGSRILLRYVGDVIPFALVTNNPRADVELIPGGGGVIRDSDTVSVYGVGISPFGFELHVTAVRALSAFVTASGGGLFFTESVPFRNTRKFNFAADLGIGLGMLPVERFGVSVGYKVHHLSNAGTGPENPGLDARLWFVGLQFRP